MQRNKPDFYGVLLSCFKLAWQLWKLVQSEVLGPDKVLQLPAGVLSRQKADSSTRQCILIELYKMCSYLTARVCRALFYAASFFRPKPFSLLFFSGFSWSVLSGNTPCGLSALKGSGKERWWQATSCWDCDTFNIEAKRSESPWRSGINLLSTSVSPSPRLWHVL